MVLFIGFRSNSHYTSNGAFPTIGIDIVNNQTFLISNHIGQLRENDVTAAMRNYIGDRKISFNRSPNNPIIHISRLDERATAIFIFTTELDVLTCNISVPTLIKLSGNPFLSITTSQSTVPLLLWMELQVLLSFGPN